MPDVEKLLNAIDAAEQYAYGSDTDGELASDRALAVDAYLGRNVDPAPTGRSQVVDRSTFETIQWILPSLCRIFANGDDVVEIPPIGPEDEEAAKQEAMYLNHVVTQQNAWFETFLIWATDALLTRNAYVLAYSDKQRQIEVERYERQTPEGLAMLTSEPGVEVVSANEYPDDQAQPQPMMQPDPMGNPVPVIDPQTGQPVMAPPPMLYDVELRRVNEKRKICIRVLPPERVKVAETTPSYRLSECNYFEYDDEKTISELRSAGFDVPDDIEHDPHREREEDDARDFLGEHRDDVYNPVDPAQRRVRVRMVWIRHDYDEDGISELLYCVRVGKTLLHLEEVSRIPVACIVPNPLPHRHVGLSIHDQVKDVERIKTAILRQGLDNLYLSNNPQKVVIPDRVNVDDVLVSRPGGVIRVETLDAIRYEKHPFVFPEAMQALEYMDQVRENRTGTNRYFTGIDQNALNKTATGIQTLSTMAAQRVEQIARIFAFGVEDLFSIVHELILKGGHSQEVVKLRGQWIQVDPATWRKRQDFKISVGFAAGNKDAMVERLLLIINLQKEALMSGVPIVRPENLHASMLELTKASDFQAPDRFWTDPQKVEQPPPPPDPTIVKAEMDAATTRETKAAELEFKATELQEKTSLEKYRIDTDAKVKILLESLRAEQGGEAAAEKGAAKATAKTEQGVDKIGQALASLSQGVSGASDQTMQTLAALAERVAQLEQSVSRPRQRIPVRDKTGRIVRVDDLPVQ